MEKIPIIILEMSINQLAEVSDILIIIVAKYVK
jgi:hypothetical protein